MARRELRHRLSKFLLSSEEGGGERADRELQATADTVANNLGLVNHSRIEPFHNVFQVAGGSGALQWRLFMSHWRDPSSTILRLRFCEVSEF